MHWWQILIRLLLAANCLGNIRDAIRAGRNHSWGQLHWLVPNAIGWAAMFYAFLPVRWVGVGKNHWEFVVWSSIALLLYGMMMKITDLSSPPLPWMSIEVPHFGAIIPQHMVFLPIIGLLDVGWDILQSHRVTSNDEVFIVVFSLGLVFGAHLLLRQFSLARVSDLVELVKPKPPPPEKQPEQYWMGVGEG